MVSPRAVPSALNRRIRCPLHRRLSCHQHDRQQGRRARIRQTVRASVDARQHSIRVVDPRAQSLGEIVDEIQGGSVGREPETIGQQKVVVGSCNRAIGLEPEKHIFGRSAHEAQRADDESASRVDDTVIEPPPVVANAGPGRRGSGLLPG